MPGVYLDDRRGQACSDLGVGASEVEENSIFYGYICVCAPLQVGQWAKGAT